MRSLVVALVFLAGASVARAEPARWIRYPALSPNGKWIAFSYRGDLWLVAAGGGSARPLTSHVAHERSPVWAADSTRLAFASDRYGNYDVFLTTIEGGRSRRLTFHSSHDVPSAFGADGRTVLFDSRRTDDPRARVGTPYFTELYSVPVDGGRVTQLLTTPAEHARPSPDGKFVAYQDLKGYENYWRKHHVSSVARDIRLWEVATGKHRRLTSYRGEDRDPVWSKGGTALCFLSERSGSFNVWSRPLGDGEPVQLTRHGPHPVRFLSAALDGTLAYAYNGDLFVLPPGGESRAVPVQVSAGDRVNPERVETLREGATEMALSPSGDEIALVVRGELFVASVKHGTTRRVTDTPGQERSLSWAPDGRALYYAAERDDSWNLYRSALAREDEKFFFQATLLEEKPVLVGANEAFQPVVSPDGKQLAYLHDRDEIRVLDLATGQSRAVVPAELNYSYSDGDIDYRWSPDSRYLAFHYLPGGRWIQDVGIVEVASGQRTNLTLSGYEEFGARWSADSATLLFHSDRLGRRSHGSWGSDGDVFGLDLTQAAHDRARLSEEEYELLKKAEEEAEDEKDEKREPDEKEKGKKKKKKEPKPVVVEAEGLEERVRRLTLHSAPVGGFALSPDGESIVYFARVEDKWALWINEIRKQSTRKLVGLGDAGGGDVVFDEEGEAVFYRDGSGKIARVEIKSGEAKPVGYAAEMTVRSPGERTYIFEHCWRQTKGKFYEANLHGVDWDAMRRNYAAFLPHISHNHDFAELLSEMVGELNASHTGSRYRIPQEGADQTAALGILFDPAHRGDGLRVAEVLPRGPADRAGSRIAAGVLLTHIDGVAVTPAANEARLLNRKVGKRVRLALRDAQGVAFEEVVKPVGARAEFELRYQRWLRRNRALTQELSKGRLGYVHVRGMNERSFRHLFQEALGRYAKAEALVVDTRFNGGGWLHDDLVTFLGGKRYATFQPRGKKRGSLGGEPSHRWYRPVVVIQSEANYSDAHVFPYAWKQLGIGKLVGTPVAGTGTAVWWETQIDPTLYYGIPQVGIVQPDGRYLENSELMPDIEVYNEPGPVSRGEDAQLARAVQEALAQIEK